jgi:hypothetical protein
MRSLLTAVGLESWLVAVRSGDAGYVPESWPSPRPFNHCILGIRDRRDSDDRAVIEVDPIGRLRLFDPTDSRTVFGDLPRAVQGSLALVMAPGVAKATRVPRLAPESCRSSRRLDLRVDGEGNVSGQWRDHSEGQRGLAERNLARLADPVQRRQAFERWMAPGAGGIRIGTIEVHDDSVSGDIDTRMEFEIPRYAQIMQGRLLMLKPFMTPSVPLLREAAARRNAVELESFVLRETVSVELPDGYRVEELPEPLDLDATFGRFATHAGMTGPRLVQTRYLMIEGGPLPAETYGEVRDFYRRARVAELSPVVLMRD